FSAKEQKPLVQVPLSHCFASMQLPGLAFPEGEQTWPDWHSELAVHEPSTQTPPSQDSPARGHSVGAEQGAANTSLPSAQTVPGLLASSLEHPALQTPNSGGSLTRLAPTHTRPGSQSVSTWQACPRPGGVPPQLRTITSPTNAGGTMSSGRSHTFQDMNVLPCPGDSVGVRRGTMRLRNR